MGRSRFSWPSDNSETQRIGRNVITLLVLSLAAAIALALIFHLGVPGTVVSLLVGGGAPAGLYMTWEGLRQAGESESKSRTEADLDRLADIVLEQWDEEYGVRTFKDPVQKARELTVSWSAANASLSVPWDNLVEAALGPGKPKVMRPGNWALSPQGLAGLEHDLPGILEKVPTGWLVVLGASGSGKTMLMLRTVRDLVEQRVPGSGDPVPVFVPMTSWDPASDSLRAWLEKQLPIHYPGLGTIVSNGGERKSRIAILLDAQKIMPFLDGLDELPTLSQEAAANRLNEAFVEAKTRRPLRLVMSCRTEDYQVAVGNGRNPVLAAAAIELHPLDPDKVSSYLAARGSDDPRWAVVAEKLSQPDGSDLATALSSPLYASLASVIYNASRPAAHDDLPDPGELCDFATVDSLHTHLLDEFIPSVYAEARVAQARKAADEADDEDETEEPRRLPAERWLMFLANYMTNGRDKLTTSLEWWDLKGLAPRWLVPGVVGTICGIATAVAATTGTHVGVGIGIGFGTGMLIAIAIGLVAFQVHKRWDGSRLRRDRLSRKTYNNRYKRRRPGPGMTGGMFGAVIGGLAAGIAGKYHIGHQASLFSGLPEALGMAIGAGASTDFIGGFAGVLVGAFFGGYLAAVGLGLPAGLVNGLGVGVAVALAIENVGRPTPSHRVPHWDKSIGIAGGVVIGTVIGLVAWREEGPVFGAVFGVLLAVFAAVPFGLRHKNENLKSVPSPGHALARDAQAFRLTALSAGLAAGAAGFLGGSMTSIFEVHGKASLPAVIADGLGIGIASGLVIGLTFGFYHAASPGFRIISWWLAARGRAPWRLKRFLREAHRLTVLRQFGPTYQFRHKELQLRLAERFQQEQKRRKTRVGQRTPEAANQTVAGTASAPSTHSSPAPEMP